MTKFGTLMTARAAASDGRVIKSKIAGKIYYQGWLLIGSAEDVESGGARVPVETPRGDLPTITIAARRG
jgi:hypothetical protein